MLFLKMKKKIGKIKFLVILVQDSMSLNPGPMTRMDFMVRIPCHKLKDIIYYIGKCFFLNYTVKNIAF